MGIQAISSSSTIETNENRNDQYSSSSILLLHHLPHELFSRIVLFLPLEDRIFCMQTCKAWYNHFILFPFSLWDTLEISEPSTIYESRFERYIKYSIMARTFGKYTHHVIFRLDTIFGHHWGIKTLLKAKCYNIQSLDVTNISQYSVTDFIEVMKLNWSTLKSIRLIKGDVIADGHLATIFNLCHSLQQFYYVGREKSVVPSQDSNIITEIDLGARNGRPFYLTHLYLDFNFKSDIVPLSVILTNSPLLRYLTLYSEDNYNDQQMLKAVRMHCKNLVKFIYHRRQYVIRHGKRNEFRFNSEELKFSYRTALSTIMGNDDDEDDNRNTTLLHQRYLHQEEDQQELLQWIRKVNATIKDLYISSCLLKSISNAMCILSTLDFPQLSELDLHCICNNIDRSYPSVYLSKLICNSPNLKIVRLFGLNAISDSVLKALGQLIHLAQLELVLGQASMISPQGVRWLFESTTTLEKVIFGSITTKKYFTNQHLLGTTVYKGLRYFNVSPLSSKITTNGVYQYTNIMQNSDIEVLQLGKLTVLDSRTILSFDRLPKLRHLEIGTWQKDTGCSRAFYKLFEARTKEHVLVVKYFGGPALVFMTSAVDYY
ncbi:hypothetical protein BDC45DRAFT_554588 [Circinella umbellata]|nr:hypothetical protein BDC45DRAFT_554588 [Circinella umbellata]